MSKNSQPNKIVLKQTWRLNCELDSGGFATVFVAQSESGEPAVVKLIPKEPGAQRELLFEDLKDVPNIIPIIDSGEWRNYWVLVMPKADTSLRHYLGDMGGKLTVEDAVAVLSDIAEALVAIEGRVVHRDIKPENILRLHGRWALADFGIARYVEATTAPDTRKHAMTKPYAAPEQWREETASSATDVYALGVVGYELISGRRPFPGPDYRGQHLGGPVPPLSGIPIRLQSLVEECLIKAPEARPVPNNLLVRLQRDMQAASEAASQLQRANAIAVQLKAEEERQESVARLEAERRQALTAAANQSLEPILAVLHRQISDNAPAAQGSVASPARVWSLNNAKLEVDGVSQGSISNDKMPFEVIAYTSVSLTIPRNYQGYAGRSHSLWYCDAQQQGAFRWYETAFCTQRYSGRDGIQPFSSPPGERDVVFALGNVMHTVHVARPFTAIDQGEEERFVERWLEWFAQAAQSQLRLPNRMPESDCRGSWRR